MNDDYPHTLHCTRGAALRPLAPGASKPKRKKAKKGHAHQSFPRCRQCGQKTACLGEVCDRCLKGAGK